MNIYIHQTNMILNCNPHGICSWNFSISGGSYSAKIDFNWVGESGSIEVNGRFFTVEKKGVLSPVWNMMEGSETLATAQKDSFFTRSVSIDYDSHKVSLTALSPFTRSMNIRGDGFDVDISPEHSFTKRAVISGAWDDDVILAFGFWLTVLMWRRSANNQSGVAGD